MIREPVRNITRTSVGGDPEFYAVDKHNLAYSSHQTLTRPVSVHGVSNHVDVLKRDGTAFEIEVNPTYCRDWIVPTLFYVLKEALVRSRSDLDKYARLSAKPVQRLRDQALDNAPEDVFVFGCKPDFNAYTGRPQHPVLDEDRLFVRYTGGHVHMRVHAMTVDEIETEADGFRWHSVNKGTVIVVPKDTDKLEAYSLIAKLSDYLIGLPMVAVLGELHGDGEAERRKLYGKAGSFRMPAHGFEYRVLSGNAMLLSPVLTYLVYGLARSVYGAVTSDSYYTQQLTDYVTLDMLRRRVSLLGNRVIGRTAMRGIINNHDVEQADVVVPKLLNYLGRSKAIHMDSTASRMVSALIEANRQGVSWQDDIVYNWGLDYAVQDISPRSKTIDHHYWGIAGALNGQLDENIFPQGAVLDLPEPNVDPYATYFVHPSERYKKGA